MPVRLLLITGALLLAAPSAASAALSLTPKDITPVNTFTVNQDVGDLDGDGHLDLVLVHHDNGPASVATLLGDGKGGFTRTTDATGSPAGAVELAHMNGDGDLDLVTTSQEGPSFGRVRIALGEGDGTFTPAGHRDVGLIYGNALDIADLNGDGDQDVVVTTETNVAGSPPGHRLFRLLGDGDGGFASSASHPTAASRMSASVADVTGDGKPDVVVSGGSALPQLYTGDGLGGLSASTIAAGPAENGFSALGELNGDGRPDLVVSQQYGFTVALNDGQGGFGAPVQHVSQVGYRFAGMPVLADFDGDGDQDLAAQTSVINGGTVLRLLGNDGNGALSLQGSVVSPIDLWYEVKAGDLDEDSRPDLVALSTQSNGGVLPFLNTTPPTGTPQPAKVVVAPETARTDSTLQAVTSGTTSGGTPLSFGLRWQRSGDGGTTFTDLGTGTSLDLGEAGNGDRGDVVRVRATSSTGQVVVSNEVPIVNSPPVVDAGGPYTGTEGAASALQGTATDADGDPLTLRWSVTPWWNADDGTACEVADATAATTSVTCTDDGAFDVELVATDSETEERDPGDLALGNAAPEVGAIALTGASGRACLGGNEVGASWTSADAAANDVLGGSVAWGDGTAETFSGAGFAGKHLYPAGRHTLTVTATDDDGGTSRRTAATAVELLYDRTGLAAPINTSGTRSTFKLGSTIPLKIGVTDCSGAAVTGLAPRVSLEKVDATATSPVNEVVSSSAADTGREMRPAGGGYAYTLSTKRSQFCTTTDPMCSGPDLTAGTYRLRVSDPAIAPVEALVDLRR